MCLLGGCKYIFQGGLLFIFDLTEFILQNRLCSVLQYTHEACETDLKQRHSNMLVLSCFELDMGDKSPYSR